MQLIKRHNNANIENVKLYIAEKPSMGRSIADVMRGARPSRGFIETEEGVVTWCVGHLFEDAKPDHYNPGWSWKAASLETLPMVPSNWIKLPKAKVGEQIDVIERLLKRTTEVVHAGDPDDEGQAIVEEVLQHFGYKGKVSRLWLRALDPASVKKAISEIKPNAEFEGLGRAAVARGRADWLVGMNLTMAFTYAARNRIGGGAPLLPIGRVQTPTLALVVQRDLSIEKFKSVDYFVPYIIAAHPNGSFKAIYQVPEDDERPGIDPDGRIVDGKLATQIAAAINGGNGTVSGYKADRKQEGNPLLHTMGSLQQECSKKLGLSAQVTQNIAQALYEKHKVTSYPRTDCGNLPESQHADAPGILKALGKDAAWHAAVTNANPTIKSSTWNDAKVTAHHGIIPTSNAGNLSQLDPLERRVFDIIALKYIQQFYPPHIFMAKSTSVKVAGKDGISYTFKATGRLTQSAGWTAVVLPGKASAAEDKGDDENEAAEECKIPDMSLGDKVGIKDASFDKKKTKPPSYYTDGSLIGDMTGIHRIVQDPEIKKRLKEADGLGTEATRAAIIEVLVKRNLLVREKKFIKSTPTGRALIAAVPVSARDPGTTAVWEGALNQIRSGTMTIDRFIEAQTGWVTKRVEEAKTATFAGLPSSGSKDAKGKPIKALPGDGSKCEKCGEGIMRTLVAKQGPNAGKTFLVCGRAECRHIPRKEIPPLPGDGNPCPACLAAGRNGTLRTLIASKGPNAGKTFLVCRDPECRHIPRPEAPKVDALPGDGAPCPTCQTSGREGRLRTRVASKGDNAGKSFLSCSAWPACPGPSRDGSARQKVDPLPDDGKKCPKCKKGKLKTLVAQKGDNAGKRFLLCGECKHVPR